MKRFLALPRLHLIEVFAVIFVLFILGCLLAPALRADEEQPSPHQICVSNLRQLATAAQMFMQDNQSFFPGHNWNDGILNYVGKKTIFHCPFDESTEEGAVSYGYSGLLLRVDGTGCNEAQISTPTEMGVVCDAMPSKQWSEGGIVYGGGLLPMNRTVIPSSRHDGIGIGYIDGHAKYWPGVTPNERDTANPIARAFIMPLQLGMSTNYGGGLTAFPEPKNINPEVVTLGGDFCCVPILMAAADAWTQMGGKWFTRGFAGQDVTPNATGPFVWGHGDGIKPEGQSIAIARDAIVIIVSKDCRIPAALLKRLPYGTPIAVPQQIAQLFATGLRENELQVYSYSRKTGTRRFFTHMLGEVAKPLVVGQQVHIVEDDWEMVEKVARDPYGIGYCSSACVDLERVTVLPLQWTDGKTYYFPNQYKRYRTVLPYSSEWPLTRTLYARCWGGAWSEDNTGFTNILLAPNSSGNAVIQAGPLFKTGYFLPE
ncbi:MAG: hypothetical protein ACYDBB_03005 [Armatimonadota bacterium]